jgi:hypothetical protein
MHYLIHKSDSFTVRVIATYAIVGVAVLINQINNRRIENVQRITRWPPSGSRYGERRTRLSKGKGAYTYGLAAVSYSFRASVPAAAAGAVVLYLESSLCTGRSLGRRRLGVDARSEELHLHVALLWLKLTCMRR